MKTIKKLVNLSNRFCLIVFSYTRLIDTIIILQDDKTSSILIYFSNIN